MEEAAGLGAAFATLLVACFLLAAHRSINDWLAPTLKSLADPQGSFLTRAALWPFARAAAGLLHIVNYVDHHISVAASHALAPLAKFVSGFAAWITSLAYTSYNFAASTAYGFERVVTHTIPREIRAATVPIWHGIDHLERDFTQLRDRLRAFAKGIDTLIAHRILPAIRALEHAIAVTIPRELGRIRGRVGTLEHDLAHPSRAWLKRIATGMWAATLFGLVIRTLARRFPWIFCRKTANVGKALCGLDQGLLNALLLDTVAIFGAISVVEFAKDLQAIESIAVDFMKQSIKEL